MSFHAVVLAGGASQRLGGADKAELEIGGARLLDRVLDSLTGAGLIVVVGPRRQTARPLLWTEESPPGGGPVAALAAGLPVTRSPLIVVLAVDLPWIDAGAVEALVGAVEGDGAILVDAYGRDQPLAGAYRRDSLAARLEALGETAGVAVRALIEGMRLRRLPAPAAAQDCDTWEDVAAARRALET